MSTVTVRAFLSARPNLTYDNCQYRPHSIPNDNHSDLKRTSSIMILKPYRKFTTFPTGDYSVFFMEDFLSNKDSSDEIIGQSPLGNIVNFAIKICRHRLYTGCKGCRIIGVSGIRKKRRTCPCAGECAQLNYNSKYISFCLFFVNGVDISMMSLWIRYWK